MSRASGRVWQFKVYARKFLPPPGGRAAPLKTGVDDLDARREKKKTRTRDEGERAPSFDRMRRAHVSSARRRVSVSLSETRGALFLASFSRSNGLFGGDGDA